MAPSARGRGSLRGVQNSRFRGRGRGGGRAGARVNSEGHGNKKSIFVSSRVEEPVDNDSDEITERPELEDQEDGSSASIMSSDSEDVTGANTRTKPYSVLLQSLNTNVQRGQPQRKKIKVEDKEELKEEDHLGPDLDLVEEPEEVDYSQLGDAEDPDEPDDADSKFRKSCKFTQS